MIIANVNRWATHSCWPAAFKRVSCVIPRSRPPPRLDMGVEGGGVANRARYVSYPVFRLNISVIRTTRLHEIRQSLRLGQAFIDGMRQFTNLPGRGCVAK